MVTAVVHLLYNTRPPIAERHIQTRLAFRRPVVVVNNHGARNVQREQEYTVL